MSISRFILVRHGETAGNKDGLFYGSTDLPLTEHGHRQAATVASYLPDIQIDTILISELQRARQTAEYIRAPKLITITATRASMKCTSASGKCSITVRLPPVTRRTGKPG